MSLASIAIAAVQKNTTQAASQKAAQQAVAQAAGQKGAQQAVAQWTMQQAAAQNGVQQAAQQAAAQWAAQQAAAQAAAQRAAQAAAAQKAAYEAQSRRIAEANAKALTENIAKQQAAAQAAAQKQAQEAAAQKAAYAIQEKKIAEANAKALAEGIAKQQAAAQAAAQKTAQDAAARKAALEKQIAQVRVEAEARAKAEAAKLTAERAAKAKAEAEKQAAQKAAYAAQEKKIAEANAKALAEGIAKEKAAKEAAAQREAKIQAEQTAISKGTVNLSTVSQSQPYNNAASLVSTIAGQMTGAERSSYVEPVQIGDQIGMNISYYGEDWIDAAKDYLTVDQEQLDTAIKSDVSGASASSKEASTLPVLSATDAIVDSDYTIDDASDREKLAEKDRLSEAKDALLGSAKKATDTLGLTSESMATDWDEIDKLVKEQQVASGTKSILTYNNAKDTLTSYNDAYESQAAYDANNCTGPLCGVVEAVTGAINATIQVSTQPIADALKPLITAIQNAINTLEKYDKQIVDTILNLPDTISDAIGKVYDKVIAYMKPYTDQISELQKGLLDLPVNIVKAIADQFQPSIDWLKGEVTKAYTKIIETKDWVVSTIEARIAPIMDIINKLSNLSMADVEAYALGKFEELKVWVYAEWEKVKETPIGKAIELLGQIVGWLVTTASEYLTKAISDPEGTAQDMWDTGVAYAKLAEKEGVEQLRQWCDEPLGSR